MAKKKSDAVVRDIKHRIRRKYYGKEKITLVLEGLRGDESASGHHSKGWWLNWL